MGYWRRSGVGRGRFSTIKSNVAATLRRLVAIKYRLIVMGPRGCVTQSCHSCRDSARQIITFLHRKLFCQPELRIGQGRDPLSPPVFTDTSIPQLDPSVRKDWIVQQAYPPCFVRYDCEHSFCESSRSNKKSYTCLLV